MRKWDYEYEVSRSRVVKFIFYQQFCIVIQVCKGTKLGGRGGDRGSWAGWDWWWGEGGVEGVKKEGIGYGGVGWCWIV